MFQYDNYRSAEIAANSIIIAARHHVSVYVEGETEPVATTADWAVMDGVQLITQRPNTTSLRDLMEKSKWQI